MAEEENETCLLCYGTEEAAAAPGAQEVSKMSPASGGGEWWIKQGNVITLSELLWWAKKCLLSKSTTYTFDCQCIATQKHSESQSEKATFVRNAKTLKYNETGKWGLHGKWD